MYYSLRRSFDTTCHRPIMLYIPKHGQDRMKEYCSDAFHMDTIEL